MKRLSLKSEIAKKISRSKKEVFLRKDFEPLGGYDQVGRALKQLAQDGILIKIGYGLYAKARPNRLSGNPMLSAPGGFSQVAKEALERLQVKWKTSAAETAYQAGSTQIPANAEVIVLDRFQRKITTGPFALKVAKA